MSLGTNIINEGIGSMTSTATHLSLHSSEPNSNGSNETSADRQEITWNVPSNGTVTATGIQFTGGDPNGDVTHVGLWSDSDTFYGFAALSSDSDDSFNAQGEFVVTQLTLAGESE